MADKKPYDPNEGAAPGHAVLHTAYVPHTVGNLVQILQEAHNKVGPQIMHMPLRVVLSDDAPEAMGWGISPHEEGDQEFALMLQSPRVATVSEMAVAEANEALKQSLIAPPMSEMAVAEANEALKQALIAIAMREHARKRKLVDPYPELSDDEIDDAAKDAVTAFLSKHRG